MDLTFKGKFWAGNICQSICQEVDDFMSKDTVRFVENQVQNVGVSVKRLVQDILPLSKDIEKPESLSTDGEQATTVNGKQLSGNQGPIDNFRNSVESMDIEVESGVAEKITRVSIPFDHQEEKKGFLDDTECVLNISSSDLLFESKLTTVEDLNCDENGSLSDPTVASAHKDGTLCDISNKYESADLLSTVHLPERVFVDISSDEEEEKEMSKRFPSCSTSPNFIAKAENACQSHVESNGFAYNISTLSGTAAAYETKAVDLLPHFLIFESNDHAFPVDVSDFVGDLPEIEMSRQSETENTDEFVFGDDDLSMEKVDLCPDMKHDETSLIMNGNSGLAATHGQRNFRYYKKLIQDALTSRKRLSKEYEHLAILFGDIDLELSQHFEPSSVPFSMNTSLDAGRTQSFHEMSETEWELV